MKLAITFTLIIILLVALPKAYPQYDDEWKRTFYAQNDYDPELIGDVKGECLFSLTREGEDLKRFFRRTKMCRSFYKDDYKPWQHTFKSLSACQRKLPRSCEFEYWMKMVSCFPIANPPAKSNYRTDIPYIRYWPICIDSDSGKRIPLYPEPFSITDRDFWEMPMPDRTQIEEPLAESNPIGTEQVLENNFSQNMRIRSLPERIFIGIGIGVVDGLILFITRGAFQSPQTAAPGFTPSLRYDSKDGEPQAFIKQKSEVNKYCLLTSPDKYTCDFPDLGKVEIDLGS